MQSSPSTTKLVLIAVIIILIPFSMSVLMLKLSGIPTPYWYVIPMVAFGAAVIVASIAATIIDLRTNKLIKKREVK